MIAPGVGLAVRGSPDVGFSLYLRCEGDNDSTTILDDSMARTLRSITVTGDAKLSTVDPIGQTSSLVLGTSGSLIVPNVSPYISVRNLEFRIKASTTEMVLNTPYLLFRQTTTGGSTTFMVTATRTSGNSGDITMYWYRPIFQYWYTQMGVNIPDFTISNHVAFDHYTNGFLFGYVNGLNQSSNNYQFNGAAGVGGSLTIGGSGFDLNIGASGSQFRGKLDNIRTSSIGRRNGTSSFVPSE